MIKFDDPKWRSPLTGSTKAVILEQRRLHRVTCAYVNTQLKALYIERARIEKELQDDKDKTIATSE